MVQALANNNINLTTPEPVKVQDNASVLDFQRVFDNKTASEEQASVNVEIEEDTVVSEEETAATITSEVEAEQVLSGILQMIGVNEVVNEGVGVNEGALESDLQAGEEIKQAVETEEMPEISGEEDITVEIPLKITNDIDTKTSTAVQTKPTETKETSKSEEGKALEEIVDEDILKELNIEALESEAGNAGSDLMKNQTPQEQGLKVMLQADVDFTEVKPEIKTAETQTASKTVQTQEANPSKIIEQITKQMEGMKSGSKISMVLNPESLGKVSIQLINTKEGLSAQFTVATQEARNLIMKGLEGLKENLLSYGVNVDNVSVKLSDTQESEYNPDWTEGENQGQNKREQGSQKERKDREQFEQAMAFAENGEV